MPCRVGITTDVERRRSEWTAKVVEMKNWRVLATYSQKSDAQAHEARYAKKYDCVASPGGPSTSGPWYVYRFEYLRAKPGV
jgi:hypothetical protein